MIDSASSQNLEYRQYKLFYQKVIKYFISLKKLINAQNDSINSKKVRTLIFEAIIRNMKCVRPEQNNE